MNAEIAITQRAVLALYHEKVNYLRTKPPQFLDDLRHEAQEIKSTPQPDQFTRYVAAEINLAAASTVLAELGHAVPKPSTHKN